MFPVYLLTSCGPVLSFSITTDNACGHENQRLPQERKMRRCRSAADLGIQDKNNNSSKQLPPKLVRNHSIPPLAHHHRRRSTTTRKQGTMDRWASNSQIADRWQCVTVNNCVPAALRYRVATSGRKSTKADAPPVLPNVDRSADLFERTSNTTTELAKSRAS